MQTIINHKKERDREKKKEKLQMSINLLLSLESQQNLFGKVLATIFVLDLHFSEKKILALLGRLHSFHCNLPHNI